MKNSPAIPIDKTYQSIKTILEKARSKAFTAVNTAMVRAYWSIGRIVVEEEQKGKAKAGYGEYLLKSLAEKLSKDFGKGFDYSNLKNMRQFYLVFPIGDALRSELSWTHYRLLMRIERKAARSFYIEECIACNWSTRELERQICSLLFERLALSRDKKGVLELAKKGHHIASPVEVWVTFAKNEDTGQYGIRQKYIKAIQLDKKKGLLLIAETSGGKWTGFNLFSRNDIESFNSLRKGRLLWGR